MQKPVFLYSAIPTAYLHEVLHLLERPHLAVVMCGVSTTLSTSRTHTASIPERAAGHEVTCVGPG